ncbi:uncharacterized protein MAM_02741 [Metarhizium album ARSEF 1941]|uniref:Uncharacterized protein n=1 Tax=Metarhizium album (strain ARSEF 1941) TaxID=1081103 RepID=A0A0B2WYA7_METAS|nr:uncharacterized protein MAM_02741 [Metarhizium album ARSEF 1941]KHN99043.1 hypothetical protein MAM_02741 [Metarhizium album ARSEF 1941]
MVRIHNLALIALSASALAATAHNERRAVDALAELGVVARDAAPLDLHRRQNQTPPDSPEIQKLKDERKNISPELEQARQDVASAEKDIVDSVPQDKKQKEEDAFQKLKTVVNGLTDDQKTKLKENGKNLRAAIRKEFASQASQTAAPSQAAPAAASAAPAQPAKF